MLKGLEKLKEFGVQDSIAYNVKFEYSFLKEVVESLEILQLQMCLFHKDAITNVTGTDLALKMVKTVDFQHSLLIALPMFGFNLPVLEQLYMSNSSLNSIEPHAFSKADKLRGIYFLRNNLHTLSKFAFPTDYSKINLYLQNNPWNCNCELFWMDPKKIPDIDQIVCSDGRKFKEIFNLDCKEYIPTIPTTSSTSFDTTSTTSLSTDATPTNETEVVGCLTQNEKLTFILIAALVSLFSVLLSNIILYICVKKYPKLLGKQKRILFLKKPENYIIMPVNKSRVPETIYTSDHRSQHTNQCCSYGEDTISYVPVRDISYFTPVSDRYTYIQQRPTLRRSVSDLSSNTVASYVTESQFPRWENDKKPKNHSYNIRKEIPPAPLPRNSCARHLDNGIQIYRC